MSVVLKREIKPEMIAFLDKKLSANGFAQDAIEKKEARELFAQAAEACVGIRESGGNNHGPFVELIQETVGRAEGEPWCMAFMQTCIAYVEHKLGVASRFPVTEHVMTAWNSAPEELKVKRYPKRGAIACWQKRGTSSGHTGMYREDDKLGQFSAIEGNTEAGVSGKTVVRDGGGVYRTIRNYSGNGNMILRGFLKPF